MDQPPPPPFHPAILVFYFIILLPFAILTYKIARRKGRSGWMALLGAIPLVNMYVVIWLASLSDAKVLQEIEELKKRTGGVQS